MTDPANTLASVEVVPDQQDSASKAHAAFRARQRPDRYCTYCDKDVSPVRDAACPDCGFKTWETDQ